MKTFDIIVIGSGSGLEISAEAEERGLSVAVVEPGPFGGTCLNRGCIPSKMLIHCADMIETIKKADQFGIKARVDSVDWPFIIRRVFDEIDREAQGIEEGNRHAANITVYKGSGRFVGEKTLEVNGERIEAETVVIAAGTRPSIPEIQGLDYVPYVTGDAPAGAATEAHHRGWRIHRRGNGPLLWLARYRCHYGPPGAYASPGRR